MKEIFSRHSVRKFQDKPIEPEKVTKLLQAAMQ
ncbi:MAG: nitroreductase family protein, partial [Helicobacteraceae bacterium]|nr:nitroreductase family protein [Helicobacteraceae bacterium]